MIKYLEKKYLFDELEIQWTFLPALSIYVAKQDGETEKVQEEIQLLQKQILERDTKICLYVDTAREEGR